MVIEMIRKDMRNSSDEEFKKIIDPCIKIITNYAKENILDEFIAFDIATYYKMNALWDEPFDNQIYSALQDLSEMKSSDCNKDNVKRLLKEKYKLEVISENPLEIMKL